MTINIIDKTILTDCFFDLKVIAILKLKGVYQMNNVPSDYSKYLVIFVDILGSKNRIGFQENYKINKIFHEEFEKDRKNDMDHTVYFRRIYTFSDCAYIFYGFKDSIEPERKKEGKLFTVALCNCEPIFLRFINENIIFRGGITYGDAYIDLERNMFFGDAVKEAYRLESEVAIHPRIIVNNYVAKAVLDNIKTVKDEMKVKNSQLRDQLSSPSTGKIPMIGEGIIERDIDEKYIYNYLHSPENNIIHPGIYNDSEEFMKDFKKYCHKQIDENTEYKVIDKYHYLVRIIDWKLSFL